MDTRICMAESCHYSPETITTLLTGSTPIQNTKVLKIGGSYVDKWDFPGGSEQV